MFRLLGLTHSVCVFWGENRFLLNLVDSLFFHQFRFFLYDVVGSNG